MSYRYTYGGALPFNASSYVTRQADHDLYKALTAGKFCYIFNSRQMGKSSLRVRVESRLAAVGTACGVLDLSSRDTQISKKQWYAATLNELNKEFDLAVDLENWWEKYQVLPPVDRLSNFIGEVLLTTIPGNIVVFIDEIDSVLSLPYPVDEFFGLIRACYERRANHPEYNRLTFALLGVATPSDLIQDKQHTPFNIGQAIQLTGFQFEEARPLARGLVDNARDPEAVLSQVLGWTGGQPFLTQKLCARIQEGQAIIPVGDEAERVEKLVRSQIIQNWESQDAPVHLRYIRDRILHNEQQVCFLLGLYQQILRQEDVAVDYSSEQMRLFLSGLVVERHNHLRVYNRIYEEVFNQDWVDEELLKKRRLYGKALAQWVASGYQDETWLLDESAYQAAIGWAKDQHLSNEDHRFLTASANKLNWQKLQRITQRLIRRFVYFALLSILVLCLILSWVRLQDANQQTKRLQTEDLVNQAQVANNPRVGALLALEAMQQFKEQKLLSPKAQHILYHRLDELPRLLKTEEHPSAVETVVFSATGNHLVSTSLDGLIKIWNVGGKQIGKWNAIAFSPDDEVKYVATANNHRVQIWETESLKQILEKPIETQAYVNAIAFSPDGKFIATGTVDRVDLNPNREALITAKIWEVKSGKLISTLNQSNSVNALAFSPDGELIVTASADGTAQVWQTANGAKVEPSLTHKGAILDVAFSSDGKSVATASLDKTAALWQVGSDRSIQFRHEQAVTAVSLSQDGKRIVTASTDKMVRVWSASGKVIAYIPHEDFVTAVAFKPRPKEDEDLIATASLDNKAYLWKIKDDSMTSPPQDEHRVTPVTFNPTVTRLVHKHPVTAVAFNRHGDRLLTVSEPSRLEHRIYTLKATNQQQLEFELQPDLNDAATAIAFSLDQQLSALLNFDSSQGKTTVKFRKTDTGKVATVELNQGKSDNPLVTFSQNHGSFATNSNDNIVRVWRVPNEQQFTDDQFKSAAIEPVQKFFLDSSVEAIALSPDGSQLVIVGSDNKATLSNVRTGKQLQEWEHDSSINAVIFSPTGQYIATASDDNKAKVIQKDGRQQCPMGDENTLWAKPALQHEGNVVAIAFSHNEQYLATGSLDNKGRVWDVKNCQEVAQLNHEKRVNAVTFSFDNHFVATASDDKTARIWDLSSHQEAARLDHAKQVNAVTFSSQGDRIATASTDGTAKLWFWQLEDLKPKACELIRVDLSQKEWQRYLPNRDYRRICP